MAKALFNVASVDAIVLIVLYYRYKRDILENCQAGQKMHSNIMKVINVCKQSPFWEFLISAFICVYINNSDVRFIAC